MLEHISVSRICTPSRARWLIGIAFVGSVLGAVWMAWRWSERDPFQPIRNIVSRVRAEATPPKAKIVRETELRVDPRRRVEASWELVWDEEWREYCHWVRTRLLDFNTDGPRGKRMELFKTVPGDMFRLTIEVLSERPLHVRLTFVGYPS